MKIGIIGTGLMGSSTSKCLSSKGIKLGYYNRTRSKAMRLAEEIGGLVHDTPRSLIEDSEVVVAFLPTDTSLISVITEISSHGKLLHGPIFINASTITPNTSVFAGKILREIGVNYVEAPVYGSVDEARDCRLISIISCSEELYKAVIDLIYLYSSSALYVGEPPRAMALKLALNNIGLALPAIIAESLMLLEAWNIEYELFKKIVDRLWFKNLVDRYWERMMSEKPARFKVWMAGKDYEYIARALKDKNLPSILADALSNLYYTASINGYFEKDYPQMAKYYVELARRSREKYL